MGTVGTMRVPGAGDTLGLTTLGLSLAHNPRSLGITLILRNVELHSGQVGD